MWNHYTDHIMFEECIGIFRPFETEIQENLQEIKGYLLLDFKLTKELKFKSFKIQPSIEVHQYSMYSSYVTPVIWYGSDPNQAHLFVMGLAAVISFVTGRAVKAPREAFITKHGDVDELSVLFPVRRSGQAAHDIFVSKKSIEKIYGNLQEIIDILYRIEYKIYIKIMQSMRLVHLAHINKREDFGLAYYLLISSIEPIAVKAITKASVSKDNPKMKEWKSKAKTDQDFKELLRMYNSIRPDAKYLQKRFIEFILKYCPVSKWIDAENKYDNIHEYIEELTGEKRNFPSIRDYDKEYLSKISDTKSRELLKNLYSYRSSFTHEGKNPPHMFSRDTGKLFEVQSNYVEEGGFGYIEDSLLPSYSLVSFIANQSITEYLRSLVKKDS